MRVDSGQHPLPVTEEESGTGLVSDSIPLTMFSCPGAAGFKVRGPTYLQDKKKVALVKPPRSGLKALMHVPSPVRDSYIC